GSVHTRARMSVLAALLALACLLIAAASASAFTTRGSVEQVDVTGLAANAQASLLNRSGTAVQTHEADPEGGLLFRKVKPGPGYRVKLGSNGETSEPVTVHTAASTPWDPKSYEQEIPDEG